MPAQDHGPDESEPELKSDAQSGIGSTPGPSHPLKFVERARPKRGFGVPKAAFDPWSPK
jgi:hypothetical protein